jgi:hypothetical protein
MTGNRQVRAGGTSHPLAPPASRPAPEAASPGAACGQVEPCPAPARTVPAVDQADGGQGNPSRSADREGTACPVVGATGQAQSSPREPSPPGSGGARGTGPAHPPVSSRITQTSPLVAEGRAGGDAGGGPAQSTRTTGAGSPPVTRPAGGGRVNAPPPAVPLSGQDFRKAWKAAESAKNAAQRRGRARRPSADASPGVGRLRVAAPRSETFDAPPPPTITLRTPEPPDEAA